MKLPNATTVLVLGILSILGSCCYGLPGLICGIVALYLYKKDNQLYLENPSDYINYSNLNTGRILAIIGIVLAVLYLILIIIGFATVGFTTDPQELMERLEEMQNAAN